MSGGSKWTSKLPSTYVWILDSSSTIVSCGIQAEFKLELRRVKDKTGGGRWREPSGKKPGFEGEAAGKRMEARRGPGGAEAGGPAGARRGPGRGPAGTRRDRARA